MKKDKVLIVGAGLCGTLLALRMAQRGYNVELREKRGDIRAAEFVGGRSINLALSDRGLKSLRMVGMEDQILEECIPMNGRMIHGVDGALRLSNYSGRTGEYINSVSRGGLNVALLEKADEFDNLTVKFDSSCLNVDLETGTAHFKNLDGTTEIVTADVVIGTDGAGSSVRRSMMGRTTDLLFNYSQDFLRTGYKELEIPAAENGDFRIEKNALHIWPRGHFMMIALPNLDGSFTVTMFHPYEGEAGFNTLNTPEKVQAFFEKYYPDSLEHLPNLVETYFENPVGPLGTIKCYPWQAFGKVVIMGDAAHAVVPFYGQGMNASFEDVRIFDEMVDAHEGDWATILDKFQESRVENGNAIGDLAKQNEYEMREKVADPMFIKKRGLEMRLEQEYPTYYSKYSLVTFNGNIPYSEAMRLGKLQDEALLELCENVAEPSLEEALAIVSAIK
jgi:kynurenine 3-monooxygenase